jgi:CMP-N-acetylneuraminic acid synthetase
MDKKLIVIPARGGSKGIPRKNLYKIHGRPLIDYTLDVARELLEAGFVDYVHVSSEDEEIVNHVIKKGFQILFLRPKELAGDYSKTPDVLTHSIKMLKEFSLDFDVVITLQVTSPIRTSEDVINAYNLFLKSNNPSLVSVVNEDHYSTANAYFMDNLASIPLNPDHNKGSMRQEIKPLYFRNGSIYITTTEFLLNENKMISDTPTLFEMPREKSMSIDSMFDIKILESVLKIK